MGDHYSMTQRQEGVRKTAKRHARRHGRLAGDAVIFPDYGALIVRTGTDGVREMVTARWSMARPPFALQGRTVDKGFTNIREVVA